MKKILFLFSVLMFFVSLPVLAVGYGQETVAPVIQPTLEGGHGVYHVYKTAITNAANVTLTLQPATEFEPVREIQIYCDQPVLLGLTGATLTDSDATTATYGAYIPASFWTILNWRWRTVDVKAATASNAACRINVYVRKNTGD